MSTEDPTYNEACAEVYDQWFGSCEEAAVALLAELAGAGRVLELGIGSGLLALPLTARGATGTEPRSALTASGTSPCTKGWIQEAVSLHEAAERARFTFGARVTYARAAVNVISPLVAVAPARIGQTVAGHASPADVATRLAAAGHGRGRPKARQLPGLIGSRAFNLCSTGTTRASVAPGRGPRGKNESRYDDQGDQRADSGHEGLLSGNTLKVSHSRIPGRSSWDPASSKATYEGSASGRTASQADTSRTDH
jgi:hypothetical protein